MNDPIIIHKMNIAHLFTYGLFKEFLEDYYSNKGGIKVEIISDDNDTDLNQVVYSLKHFGLTSTTISACFNNTKKSGDYEISFNHLERVVRIYDNTDEFYHTNKSPRDITEEFFAWLKEKHREIYKPYMSGYLAQEKECYERKRRNIDNHINSIDEQIEEVDSL